MFKSFLYVLTHARQNIAMEYIKDKLNFMSLFSNSAFDNYNCVIFSLFLFFSPTVSFCHADVIHHDIIICELNHYMFIV
jgi:hypothetical protein